MTDTVGFIRKLPHHLVASFRATLEEARDGDLLLHVVDASHAEWEDQVEVVEQVLGELELAERPMLMVFNKMDRVADPASFAARAAQLYPGSVTASSLTSAGLDAVRAALRERAVSLQPTVRLVIPAGDGARIAAVYRAGEVVSREDTPEGVALTVRMEEWRAKQLGS
jgi:GTPase